MKAKLVALALSSVLALSGCQTTRHNAATGELETSATTTGIVTGCLGGALIGALANKGKGALVGCAAGGTVGGVVGNEMDTQEAEVRDALLGSGVQIKRQGSQLKLTMTDKIAFKHANAALNPSLNSALTSVATIIKRYPDSRVIVAGHTDNAGKEDYNMRLSAARAQSVANFLMARGVSSARIDVQAFGEMMPKCTNKTPQGKSCNRRVELTLISN